MRCQKHDTEEIWRGNMREGKLVCPMCDLQRIKERPAVVIKKAYEDTRYQYLIKEEDLNESQR